MRRFLAFGLTLLVVAAVFVLLSPVEPSGAATNSIGVCCAWNDKLADGILTFKVSGGDTAAQDTVRQAVADWDTQVDSLGRAVSFVEVSGRTKADINLKFKQGGGQIQGQALRHFDSAGFINSMDITVSGSAFGTPNNATIVGQIAKHEFGHALGINHADFDGDLMSTTVSGGSSTISACDLSAVQAALHWYFVDPTLTPGPHQPHTPAVTC